MSTRTFGQRITRNEDPQLLTGRALFVDDIELKNMAHVAFVRSPFAHARLGAIDTKSARECEGVIAVYTAEDLGDYWQPGPLLVNSCKPFLGCVSDYFTVMYQSCGRIVSRMNT